MQFSTIRILAAALTLSATTLAQITGPFFITIVPEDGTPSYPATVATVSRGAQILSSALTYDQEFLFNVTSARLFKADEPTNGSGPMNADAPYLFNNPGGAGSQLEQITVDGKVYLIKAGTASGGIYAWWSIPTPEGFPVNVFWEGAGTDLAIAALRIDLEVPKA
ncbi:hypothetical protein HYFRA_00002108 [Hymenoscyphus fraxineus]|uniref:Uncharacterized protein n=1 Tax=Hymenoscyphus fraxineus TaxID=746836 RepID=A0A9N9PMI8_9HELO|nr:hypothetical protein HYFRA_00002108 [Hymenoscyphus fraxineus]